MTWIPERMRSAKTILRRYRTFFLNAVVEQADLNTPRTVTRLLSDLENAQILTLEREARGRSSALYAFRSLLKITESKQV